jgi:DNA recombination protein RmuC
MNSFGGWLLFFCGLMAGIVTILALFVWRRNPNHDIELGNFFATIQREISDLRSSLNQQIIQVSDRMNAQLSQNAQFLSNTHQGYQETMGQVQHRLGELQEATHSMLGIGKDISSLQDILRAPKLRGGIGELLLGELLRQILPEDHFSLQYTFRSGAIVDAVIFLGDALICVDAKFPLENFKRFTETQNEESKKAKKAFIQDVKKHIDSIASKYILPEEGTFDFSLMYIPAENIYYETIIKDEQQSESLAAYALRQRVVPVSPNSFYAYLQAIVRGLKGLRIEKSAQIILDSLGQLETDFKKLTIDFEKVGAHLSNAQAAYERSLRGFDKLQTKLTSLETISSKPQGIIDSSVSNPQG